MLAAGMAVDSLYCFNIVTGNNHGQTFFSLFFFYW